VKQLTILIYLRNDPSNTLRSRIAWLTSKEGFPILEGRDDAILISDNVILVDQSSAHEIFVRLCSNLVVADIPYLILPLDAESSVAVGKLPEAIKTILEKNKVPFAIP